MRACRRGTDPAPARIRACDGHRIFDRLHVRAGESDSERSRAGVIDDAVLLRQQQQDRHANVGRNQLEIAVERTLRSAAGPWPGAEPGVVANEFAANADVAVNSSGSLSGIGKGVRARSSVPTTI